MHMVPEDPDDRWDEVEVIGRCRDSIGRDWGILIRCIDPAGAPNLFLVPYAFSMKVAMTLACRAGFRIDMRPKGRREFLATLHKAAWGLPIVPAPKGAIIVGKGEDRTPSRRRVA